MTRDEKIERIRELDKIKRHYEDALKCIYRRKSDNFHRMEHLGLVPKLMYMLGLKKWTEVEYDYSHNDADKELQKIVGDFMTKKIAQCNEEIDSYLSDDSEGINFANKTIPEIKALLEKNDTNINK